MGVGDARRDDTRRGKTPSEEGHATPPPGFTPLPVVGRFAVAAVARFASERTPGRPRSLARKAQDKSKKFPRTATLATVPSCRRRFRRRRDATEERSRGEFDQPPGRNLSLDRCKIFAPREDPCLFRSGANVELAAISSRKIEKLEASETAIENEEAGGVGLR